MELTSFLAWANGKGWPQIPYSFTWATPERALQPFQEWPARRARDLRPSPTPLNIPRRSLMLPRIHFLINCCFLRGFPSADGLRRIGVWQGVGHGLPKVSPGPPSKRPYGRFWGTRPKGGWPAAVFLPFRHPTPYACALRRRAVMAYFKSTTHGVGEPKCGDLGIK
jgi:hypothetical protein